MYIFLNLRNRDWRRSLLSIVYLEVPNCRYSYCNLQGSLWLLLPIERI